ncbi:MAG: thiolase family protein [Oligoflexales bacterium]|nr:thiolase family protein [Oligoflexales bacterium]
MRKAVIVYAKRTPIGKFMGALSDIPAAKLSSVLIQDALKALSLAGSDVDELILGQVLMAGCGQAPARQAAIYGGLSENVRSMTINKVCGSGMKAVMLAEQAIARGDADVVMAGGHENMSLAPHLLMGSRKGFRFGPLDSKDHMQWDGLSNPYDASSMGQCAELCAEKYQFSREEQDAYSLESYRRAKVAVEQGAFQAEIVAIETIEKKKAVRIEQDESPFSVDLAKLPKLPPAFAKDSSGKGTLTAGNSSSISDGASLLVLMEEKRARKLGFEVLGRITGQNTHAQAPQWFTSAPVKSLEKILNGAKLKATDVDRYEINEAFSVVPLAAMRELGLDHNKVNVNGGAIALGHPLGASGARILVTLLHELRRAKLQRGLASLCIGGGEATSLLIERAPS